MTDQSLKSLTARTLKWNVVDRVASQVLYAVTGIVLARLLSVDDFGLVGAVLIFQAFASLLVDSGFSSALIQRKQPTQTDYSTVFWFNLGVSVAIYFILYACAPLIAHLFQDDMRLVALSRVMFLSFVLNGLTIVQVNRLMKRMDVKMVAVSNSLGLVAGGAVGIALAVGGFGAWAVVWQTVVLAAVKALVLWTTQKWWPSACFSMAALRGFFGIGSRMMITSFLNTLFLNIYSFFIGNRVGMTSLGYYTQSDKWSKMGIMSFSQVLTSSFLPTLSAVQDDHDRFVRISSKMNRFTAYLLFPAMLGLMLVATPLFHILFGEKWDPSIALFQLLLLRGIFTILTGLFNNYLLGLGRARTIMWMEVLRDSVALAALFAAFPVMGDVRPDNPVWGLEIMMWGQVLASFITFAVTLVLTVKALGVGVGRFVLDIAPYAVLGTSLCLAAWLAFGRLVSPWVAGICEVVSVAAAWIAINALLDSKVQKEILGHILGKGAQE